MNNDYENVWLIAKKCIVNSRTECNTSFKLGMHSFEMPYVASNMTSVVDVETCKFFSKNNWFYIMHRFGVDVVDFCKNMIDNNYITSISIGVNVDSYINLEKLKHEKIFPDYITIDIAHGWCPKMENMIYYLKQNFPTSFIIAGNVATIDAVEDLKKWGANCVKVGIGAGKVCITKNKTGVYIPMDVVLEQCSKVDIPIIADGGIREHGDFAKALSLGADMVMAGSIFSGYDQSAGEIVRINDRFYKEYYGNASEYNKKEYKNVEGKKILIEYKGDMNKLLKELKEDLQSCISYIGGNDLKAFHGVNIYKL